jgi:Polyketide cyclase / dehydrase and lipid transport
VAADGSGTEPESERPCEVCGEPVVGLRSQAHTVRIAAAPEAVYDLITDITRTGEWSPICEAGWWDDDAGPRAGAWFTGRNRFGDTVWETRSLVEVADRPREFTWLVGGGFVRWSYALAAADGGGTELTETWQFCPEGITMFHEKYETGAHDRIALRIRQASEGIPETLAAVKRIAEAG